MTERLGEEKKTCTLCTQAEYESHNHSVIFRFFWHFNNSGIAKTALVLIVGLFAEKATGHTEKQ